MRRWIALTLVFASGPALADDLAEARKHFGQASTLYNEGRYAEAIGEFERARSLRPEPVLDYDIAMSLDRLGRWEAAITAYHRYLTSDKSASNRAEVEKRVAELEERLRVPALPKPVAPLPALQLTSVAPPVTHVSKPSQKRALRIAAWATGGAALAFGVAGAALLGNASGRYEDLAGGCAPHCSGASWSSLPAQEHAGEALLGIAGALVVADVVLWVMQRRTR